MRVWIHQDEEGTKVVFRRGVFVRQLGVDLTKPASTLYSHSLFLTRSHKLQTVSELPSTTDTRNVCATSLLIDDAEMRLLLFLQTASGGARESIVPWQIRVHVPDRA